MPGPLLPIISRLGASLVGRSAAALAGTKAAAGAAVGKVKATALSAGTKAGATFSEGTRVLGDAIKSSLGQPTAASERAKAAQKLSTPIGASLAGKSVGDQAKFLQKSNNLMDRTRAASALGKDPLDVGLEERVEASAVKAEEQRLRALKDLTREEKTAAEITKKWSDGLKLASASVFFGPAAILGYKKLMDAVDGLAGRVLAAQEPLAKFSGMITSAFAILRRRQLGMQIGRARATEGSTAMLADALGDLKEALEPLRRDFITLANTLAATTAKGASYLPAAIKGIGPMTQLLVEALHLLASKLEEQAKTEAQRIAEGALPFKAHYQELLGRGGGGGGGGHAAERKADAAAALAQGDAIAWSAATREEQRLWLNRERLQRRQEQFKEKQRGAAFGEAGMPPF